jgi:hypothetical protein
MCLWTALLGDEAQRNQDFRQDWALYPEFLLPHTPQWQNEDDLKELDNR